MAKGSEKLSWKRLGLKPEERVCHRCGRTLRLEDVRQVSELPVLTLTCRDCFRSRHRLPDHVSSIQKRSADMSTV